MPDVFLSYSRDDQATARRFADGMTREGFSVWWDQTLNAGEAFDRVTEKALAEAGAVVVLWSKRSVESNWVRAEATEGRASGRLVPVMIEPCKRPIMFELTHTADLSGWSGDAEEARWRSFVTGLRRFRGSAPASAAVPPAAPTPSAEVSHHSRMRVGIALAFGVLALLAVVGGIWWRSASTAKAPSAASSTESATEPAATDSPVTLAVLPFANLSSDAEQEYFSDGLTEEILNQLAQIPALRLTGRTSSFSFKGKNEDLREIGRKLGVAYLLEGSVRKDGEQLRVTAQLIRAEDGTHLWSKTYDHGVASLFDVQDEIAKDVAQALSVKLDVTTLNRAQGGTLNVEAYDRFLRWRNLYLSERTEPEVIRQMVRLAREAVALDPGFVLAWDGLADSLTALSREASDGQAGKLRNEAAEARARVAELAPDSWIVQRERAYALWDEGKWAEAIALAETILKSGPLTLERTEPYLNLVFAVGRIEETITLMRQLQAIEPLAMFMTRDLQWSLTAVGRIDEAEAEYQSSKALDGSHFEPDFVAFSRMLAREDANPQTLRNLHQLVLEGMGPRAPRYLHDLGAALQDRARMREILRKDFEDGKDSSIRHYADPLGDAELALAAVRSRWKERNPSDPSYFNYWPLYLNPYSGMRSLPGYKELMREAGLVDYWRQSGDWGDICRPVGERDFECR